MSLRSPASAAIHLHVLVVFEHHFGVLVHEEHANGIQCCRNATSPWHEVRVHTVHKGLYNGMVGGVQVVCDGKWTFTVAVKCMVSRRCNDPIIPSNFNKVHIQRKPLTVATRFRYGAVARISSFTPAIDVLCPVVAERDKMRLPVSCGLVVSVHVNVWWISIRDQVHFEAKIFISIKCPMFNGRSYVKALRSLSSCCSRVY